LGSQNAGGVQGPGGGGNQNSSYVLVGGSNEEANRRQKKSELSIGHTISQETSIFKSYPATVKYDALNKSCDILDDALNLGLVTKEGFNNGFHLAFTKLLSDPRSISYKEMSFLRRGILDNKHLLSQDAKELLHGVAQKGKIGEVGGFRPSNMISPDVRKNLDIIDKHIMSNV
jgi:hypothetical protein